MEHLMDVPVEIIEDQDRINELRSEAKRQLGYENRYIWDVGINGTKIQLRTNNPELLDPHGIVYAIKGLKRTEPRCVYHPESKTAFAVNVDFYGKVRSLALGALVDIVGRRTMVSCVSPEKDTGHEHQEVRSGQIL